MSTLIDVRESLLKPLQVFVVSLDEGGFDPGYGEDLGADVPVVCATIQFNQKDSVDVTFHKQGTGEFNVLSGLDGIHDEPGSWRHIAEYLLTLVDAVTRTTDAGQEGWKVRLMAELRQVAATL